jgi:hypothetical protein
MTGFLRLEELGIEAVPCDELAHALAPSGACGGAAGDRIEDEGAAKRPERHDLRIRAVHTQTFRPR